MSRSRLISKTSKSIFVPTLLAPPPVRPTRMDNWEARHWRGMAFAISAVTITTVGSIAVRNKAVFAVWQELHSRHPPRCCKMVFGLTDGFSMETLPARRAITRKRAQTMATTWDVFALTAIREASTPPLPTATSNGQNWKISPKSHTCLCHEIGKFRGFVQRHRHNGMNSFAMSLRRRDITCYVLLRTRLCL